MSVAVLATLGCQSTPIDLARGPAPLRIPRPGEQSQTFEDSLTGGEVFSMYCNQCHNARALAERPFFNYENVMAHMRVRANLTGKEYEKLLAFLRRWHDVPAPTPPVDPSPKAVTFPQPIAELRDEILPQAKPAGAAQPAQAPGNAVRSLSQHQRQGTPNRPQQPPAGCPCLCHLPLDRNSRPRRPETSAVHFRAAHWKMALPDAAIPCLRWRFRLVAARPSQA